MAVRSYPELTQLLIILEGEDRPWRRVHVSPFTKLGGLHRVIQAIMGWDNRLPHRFVLSGDVYNRVGPGETLNPTSERNWRLDSAFYPEKLFWYCYGAQGEWQHRSNF